MDFKRKFSIFLKLSGRRALALSARLPPGYATGIYSTIIVTFALTVSPFWKSRPVPACDRSTFSSRAQRTALYTCYTTTTHVPTVDLRPTGTERRDDPGGNNFTAGQTARGPTVKNGSHSDAVIPTSQVTVCTGITRRRRVYVRIIQILPPPFRTTLLTGRWASTAAVAESR